MATTIVFASSLLAISALIITKTVELKRGKRNILLGFLGKLDHKAVLLVSNLKFKALQLIQSVRYIILVKTKEIIRDWFYKAQEKALNEYKKRQEMIIVGKKDIVNKGSVSFYLKKITEDKSNGEKGKIE